MLDHPGKAHRATARDVITHIIYTNTYLSSDPHLAGSTSIYTSNYPTSMTSLKISICGDTIPSSYFNNIATWALHLIWSRIWQLSYIIIRTQFPPFKWLFRYICHFNYLCMINDMGIQPDDQHLVLINLGP